VWCIPFITHFRLPDIGHPSVSRATKRNPDATCKQQRLNHGSTKVLQVGQSTDVAVGQAKMNSRDLKKIGDDGFLPTAKLWHNILLAKLAGAIFAENVVFGSSRYETLCIELCESPQI